MGTRRIYFNIRHILIVCVLLLFFLIMNFYGQNDTKPIAKKQDVPVMKLQEKEIHSKVNINDASALAHHIKQLMGNRINIVSEPTIISSSNERIVVQLEDYHIEAQINNAEQLKKTEVHLTIQQTNSFMKEEVSMPVEFVDTQAPTIMLSEETLTLGEDDILDYQHYITSIIDNYDNELSAHVKEAIPIVDGKLVKGNYDIVYECFDSSNNKGTATLHITIQESEQPIEVMKVMMDTKLFKQATSLVGKPYVWGGKGPEVFDCSGIIMYLYQLNGITLKWSDVQYGSGTALTLDSASWQPGDILSYCDRSGEIIHHALYLGEHQVLHAISSGVSILNLNTSLIATDGSMMQLIRVMRYTDQFVY